MRSMSIRWAGIVLPFALLVGCSGGQGGSATVSGTVMYKSTPVSGARVTFFSTTEVNGVRDTFSTTTDDSGKYVIAAVGKSKGLPAGAYKVTVSKLQLKPGAKVPDENDMMQIEASGMGMNVLPGQYADVGQTPLSATLNEGKNEFPIEIKQK